MKYCVYLTTYCGELLPRYYIGSTTVSKIESGKYFGSVSSQKWKLIFKNELKNNRNLFSVMILSRHNTRTDALNSELKLQIENDVVKSKNYMNESLAKINGMFGRDVSGKNNPMFGQHRNDCPCGYGDDNIAKRSDVRLKIKKAKIGCISWNKGKHLEPTTILKLQKIAKNRSEETKDKIFYKLKERCRIKYEPFMNKIIDIIINHDGQMYLMDIYSAFELELPKFICKTLQYAKKHNKLECKLGGYNPIWRIKSTE